MLSSETPTDPNKPSLAPARFQGPDRLCPELLAGKEPRHSGPSPMHGSRVSPGETSLFAPGGRSG